MTWHVERGHRRFSAGQADPGAMQKPDKVPWLRCQAQGSPLARPGPEQVWQNTVLQIIVKAAAAAAGGQGRAEPGRARRAGRRRRHGGCAAPGAPPHCSVSRNPSRERQPITPGPPPSLAGGRGDGLRQPIARRPAWVEPPRRPRPSRGRAVPVRPVGRGRQRRAGEDEEERDEEDEDEEGIPAHGGQGWHRSPRGCRGDDVGRHEALCHRHSGRRVTRVLRAGRGAGPGAVGSGGGVVPRQALLLLPPGTRYFQRACGARPSRCGGPAGSPPRAVATERCVVTGVVRREQTESRVQLC
ncbi:N-acetylglutamate synthase, mitochondrial [Balearica regulorum gibbericeps]|uniref:N-acetylglutamate synthase, mitochondrial n=1 Tax=Balearica regulorum gibbericeps TaxID=100784 RepID=UPI003F63A7EA